MHYYLGEDRKYFIGGISSAGLHEEKDGYFVNTGT